MIAGTCLYHIEEGENVKKLNPQNPIDKTYTFIRETEGNTNRVVLMNLDTK
jgi:hypothetical protein